jgi:hypothetical protein
LTVIDTADHPSPRAQEAMETAFMVLLGRMPATTEYRLAGEPLALLRRLVSSAEFFETVIAPLAQGAPLPQERQHPSPPAWMVEWLIGVLHPPYATGQSFRRARGWGTLVAGLVRNPATASRLMSDAHRREALALLGNRAPRPPFRHPRRRCWPRWKLSWRRCHCGTWKPLPSGWITSSASSAPSGC